MRHASKRGLRAGLSLLIAAQVLQPLAAHARTDLTDVPLAVLSGAKPNILFMLDNSGSMEWGSITGTDATAEFNAAKDRRSYYSPTWNQLYYNPAITYTPAVRHDAAATTTNYTTSMGNASLTATRIDAFPTTGGNVLSVNVQDVCWAPAAGPTLPRYNAGSFLVNTNCALVSSSTNNTRYARYAFYYRWVGTGAENGSTGQNTAANYQAVEIIPTVTSYTKAATRTDCGPATTTSCTYDQEIQNFANWFSYYRTRIQTAKTSLGLAFSVLDDKSRGGFATINDNGGNANTSAANFVPLADFDSTQKQAWYASVYAINPGGGTPLISALDRAGRYYQTGRMQGSTAPDPVVLRCTPNYTMFSTDGYWNGTVPAVGNFDRTVPALPAPVYTNPDTGAAINDPISGTPLVTGQNFPAPFYEGSSTASSTLADVAMKYWITDLRAPSAGQVAPNASDPATWQHMVTYTIGLGASGTLTSAPTGTAGWPVPVADTATAIDDLWHTALNGHGQYFNTKNPAVLQTALAGILNDILGRSGAAAAVAVSNPNVQSGDNSAFVSSYNAANWSGDLQAYAIDLGTGSLGSTPLWSAQAQLNTLSLANRYIGSFSGSAGVPFTAATGGLTTSQLARLNSPTTPPGPADSAAVLSYLRGDRSQERTANNPTAPYRNRVHLLGDIVDAEAVYVTPPRGRFTDTGYSAFRSSVAVNNRRKVVYQGANDGMLHAFDAGVGASDVGTGRELWAYVPGLLIDTNLSATNTSTSALVGLTQASLFRHRFFVNGTPIAGDVDLSNTAANQAALPAPNWATILVGSLGKGGRGYYALNITDPSATSDASVASKVMWEFPNASTTAAVRSSIGQSYGTPVLVKTRANGWVVLVSSGYNNGADTGGDGSGYLFVLNAATGELIASLRTGQGSSATPSGLGKISAFIENPGVDDTTDYVYGGDLLGNVWRFDLSDALVSNWNVRLLATLVDRDTGAVQPVTSAPELGRVLGRDGNNRRMVYVGTGQYLGATDIPGATGANSSATQRQSFYGLLDDRSATPTITPLRTQLVAQTAVASGTNINLTTNPVDLVTRKGWVLDFQSANGERVFTNPVLSAGILAFTTNTPSSDACAPGGSSNLYFVNYSTGGSIPNLTSRYVGNVLSSRPQLIVLPTGRTKTLVRTSDGRTREYDVGTPTPITGTRIMWREVIQP